MSSAKFASHDRRIAVASAGTQTNPHFAAPAQRRGRLFIVTAQLTRAALRVALLSIGKDGEGTGHCHPPFSYALAQSAFAILRKI
jgi:hypothetical protein